MTNTPTKNPLKILREAWNKTYNPRVLGPENTAIYIKKMVISEDLNDTIKLLNTHDSIQIKSPTGLEIDVSSSNNNYNIKVKGYFRHIFIGGAGSLNSAYDSSYIGKTPNFDSFIEDVVYSIKQWTNASVNNGPDICDNFSFNGISQNQLVPSLQIMTDFDHIEWRDDRDNNIVLPLLRHAGRTINQLINP